MQILPSTKPSQASRKKFHTPHFELLGAVNRLNYVSILNLMLKPQWNEPQNYPIESAPRRITFDPPHYTVMESVGTFEVTVVREGGDLNVAMQVDYKTEDGSAIAGPDYIEKTGTLYFAAGVTEQKITLEVLDDDVFEEDEHFYCRIRDIITICSA